MQSSTTTTICFVILFVVFHSATAQQGRIYNGFPITISDAPYMAQIKWHSGHKNHYCGGGILREDLILTAGHCVKDSKTLETHDAEGFIILVGATKKKDYKTGQTLSVQNVYPHPDFKGHEGDFNHDIGILQLSSNIMIGSNTQLIKLARPSDETLEGRKVKVSGWGTNPQHSKDKRLYQAKMSVISYSECARKYGAEVEEFKKHKICAVESPGKTCPGDSGCPLIDLKTNRVIGLDSYSNGDCDGDQPIVFTKIIDNLDFINNIMSQSSSGESGESDDSNEPIIEH